MSALTLVFPIAVVLMIGFLVLHMEVPRLKEPVVRTGRFGASAVASVRRGPGLRVRRGSVLRRGRAGSRH